MYILLKTHVQDIKNVDRGAHENDVKTQSFHKKSGNPDTTKTG